MSKGERAELRVSIWALFLSTVNYNLSDFFFGWRVAFCFQYMFLSSHLSMFHGLLAIVARVLSI